MEPMDCERSSQYSDLLRKIRGFTRALVEDLSKGRSPAISIDRFRNYCTNPKANCWCSSDLPKGKEILTLQRESNVRRIGLM